MLQRQIKSLEFEWLFLTLISTICASLVTENYAKNVATIKASGGPLISPLQADMTLEAYSNYTLKCEGRRFVSWRFSLTENASLQYKITNESRVEPDGVFVSKLTLYNVTADNVGYYYCIETSNTTTENYDDLIVQFKASRIYVFVNGSDQLLATRCKTTIIASHHADVIIPCKPSSKDIDVQLVTSTGKFFFSNENPQFDPKVGFLVEASDHDNAGLFYCLPKDNTDPEIYMEFNLVLNSKLEAANKIQISSESTGHVIEGASFTLVCSVKVPVGARFAINWALPADNIAYKEKRTQISETLKIISQDGHQIGGNILTVYNASSKHDAGLYNCKVEDQAGNLNSQAYLVSVLGRNYTYINLSKPQEHYLLGGNSVRIVRISVSFRGYPQPVMTWYDNRNAAVIPDNEKYKIVQTDRETSLLISDLKSSDAGIYTLRASNGYDDVVAHHELIIKENTEVKKNTVYIKKEQQVYIELNSEANLRPQVVCSYTLCRLRPRWPTCDVTTRRVFKVNEFSIRLEDSFIVYGLKFLPLEPGIVNCSILNDMGTEHKETEIIIGDFEESVLIQGLDKNDQVVVGQTLSLVCFVSKYNHPPQTLWYHNGVEIENDSDFKMTRSNTKYSYKKTLKVSNIQHKHNGTYECRSHFLTNSTEYEGQQINVTILDRVPLTMKVTNLENKVLSFERNSSISLECKASGVPKPTIKWYKDDKEITNSAVGKFSLRKSDTVLKIESLDGIHEGHYKCRAANRFEVIEKETWLRMKRISILTMCLISSGVATLVLLQLFIGIYCCWRVKKSQIQQDVDAGFTRFEEDTLLGMYQSACEQVDRLPYVYLFEFPKKNLIFGEQLGQGAFGKVYQAIAKGIRKNEKETMVAVKVVKESKDYDLIRAFMKELKIMMHIGQHLNVVNLLGAVTKNCGSKELMIIVEYCSYGNIQDFLKNNRTRFINQINSSTSQIDFSVKTRPCNEGANLNYFCQDDFHSNGIRLTSVGSELDDRNGSTNLGYSSSNGRTEKDFTTTALLSWTFQIARGMDYLASRKVLHGDLAARNILLCENNIVKICDFGLARQLYKCCNYKKQMGARLPIKWLSPESLGDQIFSTYSDVWSFGIVLWEIFSLGEVPYPGVHDGRQLYVKLKNGYRMEKPEFANNDIYHIIQKCWRLRPDTRPLFHVLEHSLGTLLEEKVSKHYINLNEPYLKINAEYCTRFKTDYLALMGCPSEPAPDPPEALTSYKMHNSRAYYKNIFESGLDCYQCTENAAPNDSSCSTPKQTNVWNNLNFPSPKCTEKLNKSIGMVCRSETAHNLVLSNHDHIKIVLPHIK